MELIGPVELLAIGLGLAALLRLAGSDGAGRAGGPQTSVVLLEDLVEALERRGSWRPYEGSGGGGVLIGLVIFLVLIALVVAASPSLMEQGFP